MPIFGRNQACCRRARSMTLPTARDEQTRMEIDFSKATHDDGGQSGLSWHAGLRWHPGERRLAK